MTGNHRDGGKSRLGPRIIEIRLIKDESCVEILSYTLATPGGRIHRRMTGLVEGESR